MIIVLLWKKVNSKKNLYIYILREREEIKFKFDRSRYFVSNP